LCSALLTSLEQSAAMEAGGDVGPAWDVTGVVEIGLLVDGVVVAGGNVEVERGDGRRSDDCGFGDDEHEATTTVRRTSAPNTPNRRAGTCLTRRRLS
jgi:hypothetical protein